MAISNFGIGGFDNADSSFQGLGNLVSTYNLGSGIPGCTDDTATNYNVNATWDDGSCIYGMSGCTDPAAVNYNPNVTVDNGSCLYAGCMDPDYLEYDAIYNVSNPADCLTLTTYGCTVTTTALIGDGSLFPYPIYWNSSSLFTAPCDDTNGPGCFGAQTGTNCCCEPVIVGCTTSGDINYNPLANYQAQPGSSMECVTTILGCTNPIADNYDPTANQDDGSCTYTVVYGCTDATADNYDPLATQEDGSCVYTVYGCTDPTASNYMGTPAANETQVDDLSCCIDGCMDAGYLEYDASYTCDDGTYCLTVNIGGCTDASVSNYDPTATVDDGSCCIDGCTTVGYVEYDPLATCDDGTYCLTLHGCTDSTACNYDPNATVEDGSCTYSDPTPTCTDLSGVTYTIGDLHPTLSARLAMFSYDEPDSGMATGDCGRMYASIKTVEMAVSLQTSCTYIQTGMGPVFPTNWGNDALVPGSNPSGNLSSAQSQKAGWGYQNTEDMLATGGSTANAIGVQCPWGSGFSSYHNESPAFWAKRTEFQSQVGVADWHIPSVDELLAVWNNLGPGSNYNCPSSSFGGMNSTDESCYGMLYAGTGWGAFCTKCDLDTMSIIQYMTSNEADNDPINKYTTISWWDGTIKTRIKNNFQSQTRAIPVVYEGNFGCTDSTAGNYDSTASWDDGSCIDSPIGDAHEGGIIFYLNNGIDISDGGLIVSEVYAAGSNWGCTSNYLGGTAQSIGTGQANTDAISANCTGSAAIVADSFVHNGYSDWYLPSSDEILEMSQKVSQYGTNPTITLSGTGHWTSTEHTSTYAVFLVGSGGNFVVTTDLKTWFFEVLPIRSF